MFRRVFYRSCFALLLSVFRPEDEKLASRAGHEALIKPCLQERMEDPNNQKIDVPMALEHDILNDSLICLWFASVFKTQPGGLFTAESFIIINQ